MGRKKLPQGERKKEVRIFPKESQIEAAGGMEKSKEIAEKAIIEAGKKK